MKSVHQSIDRIHCNFARTLLTLGICYVTIAMTMCSKFTVAFVYFLKVTICGNFPNACFTYSQFYIVWCIRGFLQYLWTYHVNMPLVDATGPVLVRCWQHQPSTGPVLAHTGMFMNIVQQHV